MMIDATRAELFKFRRHLATWLMIWIYPIIAILTSILLIFIGTDNDLDMLDAAGWIEQSVQFWNIPTSSLSRLLIASYAAMIFGSEYGWNTWKLIVPVRPRWQIITGKWATILLLLMSALILTDLIQTATIAIKANIDGAAMPEGISLTDLLLAHGKYIAYALVPICFTISFGQLYGHMDQSNHAQRDYLDHVDFVRTIAAIIFIMGLWTSAFASSNHNIYIALLSS